MSQHVALLFPGASYGVDRPLLRYPALVLAALGADVRAVPYPDLTTPEAAAQSDDARWRMFDEFVAVSVANMARGAARVTLLAKSLGTNAIANLDTAILPIDTAAVWITPLFGEPDIAAAAAGKPWRSLYIFGTDDRYHDSAGQALVSRSSGGLEIPIRGGDHSLEVAGNPIGSVEALLRVTKAVHEFCTARP